MDNKLINVSNMMNEFCYVMTIDEMLKKYKWFSIATGVKDAELTLKLMKQAIKENLWQFRR